MSAVGCLRVVHCRSLCADPHVASLIIMQPQKISARVAVEPCGPDLRNGALRACLRNARRAKLPCKPRVMFLGSTSPISIIPPGCPGEHFLGHFAHEIHLCANAKHFLTYFGDPWILIQEERGGARTRSYCKRSDCYMETLWRHLAADGIRITKAQAEV